MIARETHVLFFFPNLLFLLCPSRQLLVPRQTRIQEHSEKCRQADLVAEINLKPDARLFFFLFLRTSHWILQQATGPGVSVSIGSHPGCARLGTFSSSYLEPALSLFQESLSSARRKDVSSSGISQLRPPGNSCLLSRLLTPVPARQAARGNSNLQLWKVHRGHHPSLKHVGKVFISLRIFQFSF